MVKRIVTLLICLILLVPSAMASSELKWNDSTPALIVLKNYIDNVNRLLKETGESPVNSLFGCYPELAVMGITAEDNAEIPEGVEITVELYYEALNTLQLRVNNMDRFPGIAAAFIRALYGESMTQEEAIRLPADRAKKAKDNPGDSFEEPSDEMNGSIPQFYFAYWPDQYRNNENWIQMTIIFPIAGEWDGTGMIIGDNETGQIMLDEDKDPDYEGFYSKDDYNHFEVFSTATPEPDSAAAEYDFR